MGFDDRSGDTKAYAVRDAQSAGHHSWDIRGDTALMAGQNRRKSASIQKHQGLFTALKGLTNRV